MTMRVKINIKAFSILQVEDAEQTNRKKQECVSVLKETLKSYKANYLESDPAKIIATDSKIFQGLFKTLEQGSKILLKFLKIALLKKLKCIYSLITRRIYRIKLKKFCHDKFYSKRRYILFWTAT